MSASPEDLDTSPKEQSPLTEKRPLAETTKEYKGESRRWLILLVILIAQANGNIIFCTLQPISIPVAKAFGLETVLYVNLVIMMNLFNAIPMTFLSIWMYSHYSTSGVLRFVVTVLLIGTTVAITALVNLSFPTKMSKVFPPVLLP